VHRPLSTGIAPSNVDDRFAKRREFALSIWEQGVPIQGSIAEAYLRSRAITTELPPAIRYHPNLKHGPSGSYWPAMLGLITDGMSGQPIGLHRTFLAHDGGGKAPVNDAKMMLGIAKGGVVRLGEATVSVMVTEGIETGLSVLLATGVPTWAALATSGLKSLNIPPGITTVTIMADGDDKGEEAALAAARRLKSGVRSVRIVRAPRKTDFNDVLRTTR
jgi:hypothetical protein